MNGILIKLNNRLDGMSVAAETTMPGTGSDSNTNGCRSREKCSGGLTALDAKSGGPLKKRPLGNNREHAPRMLGDLSKSLWQQIMTYADVRSVVHLNDVSRGMRYAVNSLLPSHLSLISAPLAGIPQRLEMFGGSDGVKWVVSTHPQGRLRVVQRPFTPPDVLRHPATSRSFGDEKLIEPIKASVALHPRVCAMTLRQLSTENACSIRMNVAANINTDKELLSNLLNDRVRLVGNYAASNPKTDVEAVLDNLKSLVAQHRIKPAEFNRFLESTISGFFVRRHDHSEQIWLDWERTRLADFLDPDQSDYVDRIWSMIETPDRAEHSHEVEQVAGVDRNAALSEREEVLLSVMYRFARIAAVTNNNDVDNLTSLEEKKTTSNSDQKQSLMVNAHVSLMAPIRSPSNEQKKDQPKEGEQDDKKKYCVVI